MIDALDFYFQVSIALYMNFHVAAAQCMESCIYRLLGFTSRITSGGRNDLTMAWCLVTDGLV